MRADSQDHGRGRMGRSWHSPLGNCYASTIIRLKPNDPQAAGLAFVVAVAVHETLQHCAPEIAFTLKWPNDILIGQAKLCGILLERRGDAIVAGVGVNLAHYPEDIERPATSLAAQGVTPPTPQDFVTQLATNLRARLSDWRKSGLPAILAIWREHAHAAGTELRASLPDGEQISGSYIGLAEDGALKLRLADGSIRAIHAGDIFLI